MDTLDRDYLTAKDAATALGLPKRTVIYRLARGLMQGVQVGGRLWLMPRTEVERWQGQGKISPPGRPRRGGETNSKPLRSDRARQPRTGAHE
jgi:excisionase family DNA binding protein